MFDFFYQQSQRQRDVAINFNFKFTFGMINYYDEISHSTDKSEVLRKKVKNNLWSWVGFIFIRKRSGRDEKIQDNLNHIFAWKLSILRWNNFIAYRTMVWNENQPFVTPCLSASVRRSKMPESEILRNFSTQMGNNC